MLDRNGFSKKTYSQIIDEMEEKTKELFGEDTNTKAYTPLGIIIRVFAWFHALLWEVVERVYNNSFPSTAEGVSLDRLAKLKGMTRLPADYAYGQIQITGTANETIPAGLVVGTKTGVLFETTEDCVLDANGVGNAEIYAQETGSAGNVEAGTITEIVESDSNVSAVVNPEPTTSGRDQETDAEFYERFKTYPEKKGSSNIEGIRAVLLETAGVRDAIVSQNTTNTEKDGLPPHCIAPFVFGGTDEDVAQAIFSVAGGGIQVYGTTVVSVTDSQGTVHEIGFTRPETIQVYVRVTLTKGAEFPSDGLTAVRNQILNYIGGNDENGNEYPGLGLKQNVVHAKIVAAVLNSVGVDDAIVELSTDGINYVQNNIIVNANQVAKTTYDKVVVS
ncbi:baseplate J/gp47 family protein [Heyndrickxia coagulans]|uniref:baseplate J/gp47 family protein n=1 Tax=Heyndrickxia coagulans TaxID=1398 RepID=UPI002235A0D8|nr:baseplate J/gp47 family protein [Heyndrickxia coagulans]UZH06411.1 baseplate J/gp47 family protein [Heyndrickxia coagulans]UZH06461.1 baseplate J/gp47 family protein [Heyndrickxia coagulans]